MIKRKTKIINKEFQLKTIFTILGIIIITFLIIIAFLGIDATIKNKEVNTLLNEINSSVEVISKNESLVQSRTSLQKIEENTKNIRDLESGNFRIVSVMLGIVLLMSFLLYFYLINLTHRISGPLYVIKQYMDAIVEGEKPEFRNLREKDEFKDFYYSFIKMIETINNIDSK